MKTAINTRSIKPSEFMNLKKGCIVYSKENGHTLQHKVTRDTFWNSDADEPDYEVETTNGYYDMYSLYVRE
jgi:hypothetical protein